jgi:hypothetical protein
MIKMSEPKIIDVEVHYNSRWEKVKHKAWKAKEKVKQTVRTYPKECMSFVILGGAAIGKTIKKWKSIQPTQAELDREWKDLHIYDRSIGMYYPLRRKMTPRECMEFERRKRAGEPTGHILESMRLLKY